MQTTIGNYLVSVVHERGRVCKKCNETFALDGFKIGKKEGRVWNSYHPLCFWGSPEHQCIKPFQLDCYNSLTGDQQYEIDEVYKKEIEVKNELQ